MRDIGLRAVGSKLPAPGFGRRQKGLKPEV
jgi:hypothetical protein